MYERVVLDLKTKNYTISTMESCTGGAIANAITNIEGASEVFKFSAVTYSNEFKIKMGVSKETIDKYSVYSMEVAKEMAFNIVKFTSSTFGVGITGKLNKEDKANMFGVDNQVFISIYDSVRDKYFNYSLKFNRRNREVNKKIILKEISKYLEKIISED